MPHKHILWGNVARVMSNCEAPLANLSALKTFIPYRLGASSCHFLEPLLACFD